MKAPCLSYDAVVIVVVIVAVLDGGAVGPPAPQAPLLPKKKKRKADICGPPNHTGTQHLMVLRTYSDLRKFSKNQHELVRSA